MARYYCEYCRSYLTHDTLSVRKFHLMGKNHIKVRADYYRSKSAEQKGRSSSRRRRLRGGDHKQTLGAGVKLLTRKEKRRARRQDRAYARELRQPDTTLGQVYAGSPGYNRVFVAGNRLDVGESVRSSKLPQRANARQQTYKDRYEPYAYYAAARQPAPLAPPPQLAQWRTAYTQIYITRA